MYFLKVKLRDSLFIKQYRDISWPYILHREAESVPYFLNRHKTPLKTFEPRQNFLIFLKYVVKRQWNNKITKKNISP